MSHKTAIVYTDSFQEYNFGPTHPLTPIRLKLTFELMRRIGLLDSSKVQVHEPRQASRDELLLFHTEEYLQFVKRASDRGSGSLDMGDTPVFKGCFEASALAVGASLTAVDLVMSGKVTYATNIAGGLHHAHPGRASGFCIFNDPAISIAYLKKKYSLDRILYLDVDAHHGDGVMYGFYSDPGVLDIDFHEDGRHLFPGTGSTEEVGTGKAAGVKINVPLAPFTGDRTYLPLFREIVSAAVRKYKPQVLLVQCGADSHANDLLAHLQLTTETYRAIAVIVRDLANEVADGRLVVFGGGGYNPSNVARAWTIVTSTLAEFVTPRESPNDWQRLFEGVVGEKAPALIESSGEAKNEVYDVALNYGSEVLQDLKRRIPLLVS
jgi:acetoin utilization protein AcuC